MSKRLKAGSNVVIGTASPPGHVRTPTYLKGKRGVVVGDHGAWRNPEELAYGKDGLPKKINYWVQFRMDELWAGKGDYGPNDTVCVEIYEKEPRDERAFDQARPSSPRSRP
jgi:nitrile hydratase subunit beta